MTFFLDLQLLFLFAILSFLSPKKNKIEFIFLLEQFLCNIQSERMQKVQLVTFFLYIQFFFTSRATEWIFSIKISRSLLSFLLVQYYWIKILTISFVASDT